MFFFFMYFFLDTAFSFIFMSHISLTSTSLQHYILLFTSLHIGNQNGGWMPRLREHPALTTPGVYVDPTTSVPTLDQILLPKLEEVIEELIEVYDPLKANFSMEEVEEHNSKESAWFVVNNKVYDGTPFLAAHPGD